MAKGPADKKLHPQAASLAKRHIIEFAQSLVYQSKLLAFRRGDDEVQSSHVADALRIVNQIRRQGRKKSLVTILGSGMFGVFVSQSVTQFLANNISYFAGFVIVGVVGLWLIFYGTGLD